MEVLSENIWLIEHLGNIWVIENSSCYLCFNKQRPGQETPPNFSQIYQIPVSVIQSQHIYSINIEYVLLICLVLQSTQWQVPVSEDMVPV